MHWLLLGLTLPRIGLDIASLRADHYLLRDRSPDLQDNQSTYSKARLDSELGQTTVYAGTQDGVVVFLAVSTRKEPSAIVKALAGDARCASGKEERFSCSLADNAKSVEVAVCGRSIIIAPASEFQPQARTDKLCATLKKTYDKEPMTSQP